MNDFVDKFSSVTRNAVWATAADQIKALIESGTLPAESRLPSERALCERLGISRVSLREALRVLESDGYVSVKAGRGTFVRPPDDWKPDAPGVLLEEWGKQHDELLDKLLEMRGLIEPGIAGLAARNAGTTEVAALRRAVDGLANSEDRTAVGIEWDAEFHRLLAYATGNSMVGDLIDYVMTATGQEREVTLSQTGGTAQAAKGHRRIVDAIEAGDVPGAEAAMREHLKDARIYVRRAFRDKARQSKDD